MSETKRDRAKLMVNLDLITKEEFVNKTGFSEDQWYYWFGDGKKIGPPNSDQIEVICSTFDWSPTYIFFGLGFVRLSEIKAFHESTKLAQQVKRTEERQTEILSKLDQLTMLLTSPKTV